MDASAAGRGASRPSKIRAEIINLVDKILAEKRVFIKFS
jgi:hypothetical protein